MAMAKTLATMTKVIVRLAMVTLVAMAMAMMRMATTRIGLNGN